MVVIRLARVGTKNRPKYRVTVADSRRCVKNGKFLEVLGIYNPKPEGQDKELTLNVEKYNEWVKKGAQPTMRVKSLFKHAQAGKS